MKRNRKAGRAEDMPQRIVLSEQSIGLTSVPNAREPGGYINTDSG